MRKAVLVVVALPLLSACSVLGLDGAAEHEEMVKGRLAQMSAEFTSCGSKRGASHVETAQCVNTAFQSAMLEVDCPYPDIVATLSAERLRAAEQIDKGLISGAEGTARMNDKIADVIRLERARRSNFIKTEAATPPEYFLELLQVGV